MGAPYPPVPGTIQVNVQGTIPGEQWENVLHFAYSGPAPSSATLTSWATSIYQAWTGNVSALQPPQVTLEQVTIVDIGSTTGAEGLAVAATAGTRVGTDIGANTAFLISYPLPTRYRGGKPRSYLLVGVAQDLQNPMSWLPAFETSVVTVWKAFLNNVVGVLAGGNQITQLVGLRRHGKYLPNAGPPNYVLTTPIAYPLNIGSLIGHAQVASQKGRIGRRSK